MSVIWGGQHNRHNCACNSIFKEAWLRADLLLCAVDQLVFIGPLKARLHAFIIPKFLHMIKEFLKFEKVTRECMYYNLSKS